MKPKKIEIQDKEFYLNPMKPRQALRVTKNLLQIIGAGMKNGTKQEMLNAISSGLSSLDDDAFDELLVTIFKRTQVASATGPLEITDAESFDLAFEGINMENIFMLVYEVLVYNRFPLVRDLDLNIGELIEAIKLSDEDEISSESKKKNTESPESSVKN